jgi:hypothetical protein
MLKSIERDIICADRRHDDDEPLKDIREPPEP